MGKAALTIAIAGMFVLFYFMLFAESEKISEKTNISQMTENTPVSFSGFVSKVSSSGGGYLVSLDTGISFVSDIPVKQGDNLSVSGVIEQYYDKMRIRALKITK